MPPPLPKSNESSETNLQVDGVGEADTVKTYGEYFYPIQVKSVYITKITSAEQMAVVSALHPALEEAEDITPIALRARKKK